MTVIDERSEIKLSLGSYTQPIKNTGPMEFGGQGRLDQQECYVQLHMSFFTFVKANIVIHLLEQYSNIVDLLAPEQPDRHRLTQAVHTGF